LIRSPVDGEVIGLRAAADEGSDGVEGGDSHPELWDPAWRAQLQAIDRGLKDRDNLLLNMSQDAQRYLVYSSGNGKPGEYYLGDRRTGELALLGETYPALDPAQLVGKETSRIKARDGLALNTYLSLPAGRRLGDGGAPLPLILFPHGGPQSRDDDDFDPWTEFLANRGYAVLQVNFRGSDGYGRQFKDAGLRRWGMEMQDDLTDAGQWAIAQKIADAKRVCIVGGSYGGYAALMGVVKTPELYRCAVSLAGVSDLQEMISFDLRYIGGSLVMNQIGDPWKDRERLRATSPALQADRIRVPVLLVHGTDDLVVPVAQSQDMAKALRSAGKKFKYIEQEGGDHHLSSNAQRLEFFKAMEGFLAENLKGQ
jgi:dipeptidyl aminopeptidase/acylaminoacyl peptidase